MAEGRSENLHVQLCRDRHDGKLPALGVRDGLSEFSPISGLGFEKVFPHGNPAAMKPIEEFDTFNWPASPTEEQEPLPLEFPGQELNDSDIPDAIHQFVDMMQNIYEAMENEFPPAEENEDYPVFAAAVKFKDTKSPHDLQEQLELGNVLTPMPRRLQLVNMVAATCSGFLDGNAQSAFLCCFQAIVSDLDIDRNRAIKVTPAPSETSQESLSMGVPHCLVYGLTPTVRQRRSRPRSRSRSTSRTHGSGANKTGTERPRHRPILKKRTYDRSQSRSSSGSPAADHRSILGDVKQLNENLGVRNPTYEEMERNPELYCIKADSLRQYMEPHKPDLSLIRRIKTGDDVAYRVEVVAEITNVSRFGMNFDSSIDAATEQCISSCIASLQSNQTCIYGIVILVEGMKALKVVKENNQWNVYETELIQFCEGVLLKRMLYKIFDSLR